MYLSLRGALATVVLLAGCGQGMAGNSAAAETRANATTVVVPRDAGSRAPDATAATNTAEPVAPATPAANTATKADREFAKQMTILLVGRGTIDGQPITGVRAIDKCHTAFATAGGETVVDWTGAGNLAARNVDGRDVNDVPGANGSHQLSVPQGEFPEPVGNAALRSSGGFGQLALECGG